jgi:hypothetical protein
MKFSQAARLAEPRNGGGKRLSSISVDRTYSIANRLNPIRTSLGCVIAINPTLIQSFSTDMK